MMQFELGTIAFDTSFNTGDDSGVGCLGLGLPPSGASTGSSPCSSELEAAMFTRGTSTGHSPSSGTSSLSPASVSPRSDTPVSSVSSSPSGSSSDSEKPPHSYIALISMAILNSKEKKLLLGDIYKYITDSFIYYAKMEDRAWRNSIRHNLSLNECFIKNGRADNGKGSYWSIHPACVEDFRKGDYRRRQARRRAKKGQNQVSQMPAEYRNSLSYVPMSSVPLSSMSSLPLPSVQLPSYQSAYPGYQPYQPYSAMTSLGYPAADFVTSAAMSSAYTRTPYTGMPPVPNQTPLDLSASNNNYSPTNSCAYTEKPREITTQAGYQSQQSQAGPVRSSHQMKERRTTAKPYSQSQNPTLGHSSYYPLTTPTSMMQSYMAPYSQFQQTTMMPAQPYDSYNGLTPFSSVQLQALWESMNTSAQQRYQNQCGQ